MGESSGAERKESDQLTASGRSGQFLCWGCGEFGQHCHGDVGDVSCRDGFVERFSSSDRLRNVKAVACGSSHTIVVIGKLIFLILAFQVYTFVFCYVLFCI